MSFGAIFDLLFPTEKEESSREPEPNPYLRRKYEG